MVPANSLLIFKYYQVLNTYIIEPNLFCQETGTKDKRGNLPLKGEN